MLNTVPERFCYFQTKNTSKITSSINDLSSSKSLQIPKKKVQNVKYRRRTDTPITIEYKTPLKAAIHIHPFSMTKENEKMTNLQDHSALSGVEKTEVKQKAETRILSGDQVETEARKYYKILGSTEVKENNLKNLFQGGSTRKPLEFTEKEILQEHNSLKEIQKEKSLSATSQPSLCILELSQSKLSKKSPQSTINIHPFSMSEKRTEIQDHSTVLDLEKTEVKVKTETKVLYDDQVEKEGRRYYKIIGLTEMKENNFKNLFQGGSTRKTLEFAETEIISQKPESLGEIQKDKSLSATSQESLYILESTQANPSKKNPLKEDKKEESMPIVSPESVYILEPSQTKTSKKRKCRPFEDSPLYVSNKKLKHNSTFYKEKLKLFDSSKKEYIKFRVFKESELGHGKYIQNTLRESKIDDDCPTDSEQLELAKKHVQKQLRQALEIQNPLTESDLSMTTSSSFESRYTHSSTLSLDFPSFGSNSSESEYTPIIVYVDSPDLDSKGTKKVVKKLSYSKL